MDTVTFLHRCTSHHVYITATICITNRKVLLPYCKRRNARGIALLSWGCTPCPVWGIPGRTTWTLGKTSDRTWSVLPPPERTWGQTLGHLTSTGIFGVIITTRVRSTREGNVLTRVCVSVHTCGGGRGGTPYEVWVGGYPISGLGRGGTPSQVWVKGYPISGLGRGVPHLRSVRYPISGWGVPQLRSGGYPILGQGGTPPQAMEGGIPSQVGGGYPIPGLDRGVPYPRSGQGYLGYPPP